MMTTQQDVEHSHVWIRCPVWRHFGIASAHTDQKFSHRRYTVGFLSLSLLFCALIHLSHQPEKIMHWWYVSTSSLKTQQVVWHWFTVCSPPQCWHLYCVALTWSRIQFGILTDGVIILDSVFSEPKNDESCSLAVWAQSWYESDPDIL
jgi:hypothetical protein